MSPSRKTQLEDYRKKRDPARTPEPFGEAAEAPAGFPVAKEAAAALFAVLGLVVLFGGARLG